MDGAGPAFDPAAGGGNEAPHNEAGGALPLLSEAFEAAERQYGGREAAAAMISIVVANAVGRKRSRLYSELLRANADILDGWADGFPD